MQQFAFVVGDILVAQALRVTKIQKIQGFGDVGHPYLCPVIVRQDDFSASAYTERAQFNRVAQKYLQFLDAHPVLFLQTADFGKDFLCPGIQSLGIRFGRGSLHRVLAADKDAFPEQRLVFPPLHRNCGRFAIRFKTGLRHHIVHGRRFMEGAVQNRRLRQVRFAEGHTREEIGPDFRSEFPEEAV